MLMSKISKDQRILTYKRENNLSSYDVQGHCLLMVTKTGEKYFPHLTTGWMVFTIIINFIVTLRSILVHFCAIVCEIIFIDNMSV